MSYHTYVEDMINSEARDKYPFVFEVVISGGLPNELFTWLKTHAGRRAELSSTWGWKGKWISSIRQQGTVFGFVNKNHAMLFKLTWAGR